MSVVAKVVLAASCVGSIGIISFVHYKQQADRKALRRSVIVDVERQERRKAENLFYLQQQIELTKELQKIQYPEENLSK